MHLSTWQMLVVAVFGVLTIIPMVMILRRMGYSGWWAVLAPLSPFNIVGLWVLAFAEWPAKCSK